MFPFAPPCLPWRENKLQHAKETCGRKEKKKEKVPPGLTSHRAECNDEVMRTGRKSGREFGRKSGRDSGTWLRRQMEREYLQSHCADRAERQTQTLFFFVFWDHLSGVRRVSEWGCSILVRIHPFTFFILSFFLSFLSLFIHSFIHSIHFDSPSTLAFSPFIHSSPSISLTTFLAPFRNSCIPSLSSLTSGATSLSLLGGSAGLDYTATLIYYHGYHWRRQLPRLDIHSCLSLGVCLWRYICVFLPFLIRLCSSPQNASLFFCPRWRTLSH